MSINSGPGPGEQSPRPRAKPPRANDRKRVRSSAPGSAGIPAGRLSRNASRQDACAPRRRTTNLQELAMSRLRDFQGIEGQDFFEMDLGFQSLLKDLLPEEEHSPVFNSLHHCARLVAGRWNDLA